MSRNMIRTSLRIASCLILLCISGESIAPGSIRDASAGRKAVLVLYTYNFNQPAQQQIVTGLESARITADIGTENFVHEFLDIAPPRSPQQRLMLRDLLLRKYEGYRFDLIITVFDGALDFLMHEGQALSPESPCLALYSQERPHLRRGGREIIQSPLAYDIQGTLKLALQLFPRTRTVLFVSGQDPVSMAFERRARVDFALWQGKIAFEFTSNMSVPEVLKKVGRLPPDTIVIYARIASDITGSSFPPKYVASMLAKASNRPVFCLATSQLDTGVVGGSLVDVQALGMMLGKAMPALMSGKPVRLAPAAHFIKPMVNWRQIERWGIEHRGLPAGTMVINRPPTLWNQYRQIVLLAMAGFLVLICLLIVLAIQNHRRRKAERAARESEARYRVLIEHAPDAIVVYDVDLARFVDANARAEKLFGCSREELLQAGPQRFYAMEQSDPRDAEKDLAKDCEQALTGRVLQFERAVRAADGRQHDCEVYAVRLPFQKRRLVRVSFIDITERKRVAKMLTDQIAFVSTLLDTIPSPIFYKDASGKFLGCNRAFEEFQGMPRESIIGKTSYDINPVDIAERYAAMDQQLIEQGGRQTYEWKERAADGTQKDILFNKAAFVDSGGSIAGLVGFLLDLTERKKAEEEKARLQAQLNQAQKMESVGRLAGGVAHDFNNMLSVILGHVGMIMEMMNPADSIQANLMEIQKAAQRSADLTRQLLAFARKQTVEPKVLDLNETVKGMLKMLGRLIGEDIKLTWRPGGDLWAVKIDPSQVDQILANLCINARDAITGVGNVVIETGNMVFDELGCAQYTDCIPGEYVFLSVMDDGYGMGKDVLEHIFEPFFTTKDMRQGTGLGLATVYGIVKQNEGFINVYSEPNNGSIFKIYLRRCRETPQGTSPEKREEMPRGHGETILIVEDDAAILQVGKAMLESLGYTVLSANTPDEALLHAHDHADELAVLFTDVIMPEMNGWELENRIKNIKPGIKCLFTSGYTADIIATRGVLKQGVHFLQKPYVLKDLALKMSQTLQ